MATLDTGITNIKGIGETRARALAKLGITTLGQLIAYFPRRYEDRRAFVSVQELERAEEPVCVRALVVMQPSLARLRAGLDLVRTRIADDSASINVSFFNQSYVKDALKYGEEYDFFGKPTMYNGRLSLQNPLFEPAGRGGVTGCIAPVYRLTAGVGQGILSRSVAQGLNAVGGIVPDALPRGVREQYQLAHADFAYQQIHFPESMESLALARKRLAFEELFVLSCALGLLRRKRAAVPGAALGPRDAEDFFAKLPFAPTGAQRRAVGEAFAGMCSGEQMSRLVQGDVGSGKTVVAAACVWLAVLSGKQAAVMAPTEILAEQHLKTFTALLSPFGVSVGLLTGSLGAKGKRELKAALASGELDVVVGTHALISENVEFRALALVVADEQHRFGVRQRSALTGKGDSPHVLVMSATPIPRTMALIIYGELDVSVIDELPPGRQRVDTFAVGEDMRERILKFMLKLVGEGRQVYIVCPMVDENENLDVKSAKEYVERLRKSVPEDVTVGLVHGKLKAKDKEAEMRAFAEGRTKILVATTVIEVGVDVPNAALMVVEDADRFGLSQLHQLRGRVGRGEHKSYCVLFSSSENETARQRLQVMCRTNDGFKISEEDLKLRGPGDFFGSRQHGLPEMKIADLNTDMTVLQDAQSAARAVLERDGELSSPENARLLARVREMFAANPDGFN